MSHLTSHLARDIKAMALPEPSTEHRFHPVRRWRFDFAWPDVMLAVEVEGGVYANGRHSRGAGFTNDCEKYNEATLMGWRVLRVTAPQIKSGQAVEWLRQALESDKAQI